MLNRTCFKNLLVVLPLLWKTGSALLWILTKVMRFIHRSFHLQKIGRSSKYEGPESSFLVCSGNYCISFSLVSTSTEKGLSVFLVGKWLGLCHPAWRKGISRISGQRRKVVASSRKIVAKTQGPLGNSKDGVISWPRYASPLASHTLSSILFLPNCPWDWNVLNTTYQGY